MSLYWIKENKGGGKWKKSPWYNESPQGKSVDQHRHILALLVFFSLLLHFNMYVCVTFSICFLGFGHALFEWVVWETKPKKSQGLWSNELRWQFYLNWNNWAWKITTIIYFTMWIQLSTETEKKFLFTYIYNHNE